MEVHGGLRGVLTPRREKLIKGFIYVGSERTGTRFNRGFECVKPFPTCQTKNGGKRENRMESVRPKKERDDLLSH